jgi:hypothetical protein
MVVKMTEIRKRVVLISFSTKGKKFHTPTERNQFFRELYGWNQVVIKNGKRYDYSRNGILGDIPHLRIEDSVFMVPEDHLKEVNEYFNKWKEMVDFHMMKMMLLEKKLIEEMENSFNDDF